MNLNFNQKTVWERLKFCNFPIILYGMGNGAEKVIKQLNNKKIPFQGIMASDNFARYQNFCGYTVKKLADFEKEFKEFIILLCFGSDLPDVINHICRISEKHTLLAPTVALFGDETVDDEFLERYEKDISSAYDLLSDSESENVFLKSLEFMYTGDINILKEIESSKDEALSLLDLSNTEHYLDLGAYNGDTVKEFLSNVNGYKSITAVEPNPKNFSKLLSNTEDLKSFYALNMGISDTKGISFVSRSSGRMATLSSAETEKSVPIGTVTVDELFDERPLTYIKADIEGMEEKMISGAANTLRSKPKLCISAYHKPSDMFRLILKINEINSEYKFYLRKHRYIPLWDLNIYAK